MATGCVTDGAFQNLDVKGTRYGGKKNVIILIDDRELTADESGSVVFLNHAAKEITLPAAEAGLHFRFVLGIDATAGCTVIAAVGDCFFGQVRVFSTTADQVAANQDLDYATAVAADTTYDHYDFVSNSSTLGGGSGDYVDFYAVDDIAWCGSATLSTVHANPGSIATINNGGAG